MHILIKVLFRSEYFCMTHSANLAAMTTSSIFSISASPFQSTQLIKASSKTQSHSILSSNNKTAEIGLTAHLLNMMDGVSMHGECFICAMMFFIHAECAVHSMLLRFSSGILRLIDWWRSGHHEDFTSKLNLTETRR